MRKGEGIAAERGEVAYAEKSSSNSPGLSLLDALAGCPLNLHRYPMLCFWRKGDRGVIMVGVSGEKSGETNGLGGKWPLAVVAIMKFVEMGVVDDGDDTEMVGES